MDYGQTGTDSREENNMRTRTECKLEELFKLIQSEKLKAMSSPNSKVPVASVNHLGSSSQRERNCSNRDSGNCSGSSFFSNLAYLKSPTDSSEFLEPLTCDSLYMNEHTINGDNHPVGSDTGKTLSDDSPDEMLTRNKLITTKNPIYPTLRDSDVIVCDNEYQDVRSLTNSTKEKCNSTTSTEVALGKCGAMKVCETGGHAPSFQQFSLTPSLHIMRNVEIIDSYHPV